MKSSSKFILASLLATILTVASFGMYSLNRYHDSEVNNENIRLETCLRTFWQLLSHKGSDFRIVDNKLQVGSYVINGNFELPDRIQEIFGGVATVFMNDERVSTNVLTSDGKRALGTKLIGPAYDSIFKEGKPYRGTASILGIPYLTAYDPIVDNNSKIIGVLFVGVKESDFLTRMHVMKNQLTMTLFSMLAVLTFLMVLLGLAMKRVEENNESQLKFQKTLMDTIPSPIFYKDSSCRYLGCNKAFEEYVGYTLEQLVGKTPHDLWPTELADSYREQDLGMINNPGMKTYETTVRYADGTLRDVIFNKATFAGKDGSVAGLVGVILDITERKLAEEESKNSYQRLLDIVDFLPDATFVTDMDKRVIAWNRAIEKMTGLKKADVIGKGDFIYSVPFYGERRPILIDLIDQDPDQIRLKYEYITIEGRTLFAETFIPNFRGVSDCYLWGTATPLFDSHGKQVGSIESIRDITEYKQAVDEKIRLRSQVEYAHLMETIMIRLGHDLKTPLTPLFILLPLLKKQLTDPAQTKQLDACFKSAVTIKNLADKTRTLARLSSGSEEQNKVRFTLAALVDEAIHDCREAISQNQIECQNIIDQSLVVHGLPDQLRELFNNLISNAVHFSKERGNITIFAEHCDNTVTVSVRDEGIGITEDLLEHIFDEFFKADESRHNLEASGLGLSICKRIVQNHYGRIWAESPGHDQGTTINFTIEEKHADIMLTAKGKL
jgi:PAS domain S-box-containing protein